MTDYLGIQTMNHQPSPFKVVFISSGQPSLNPRLVKEADSLVNEGIQVTVIYQYWNEWGTQMDKQLLIQKKWKAIRVGGSPNENKLNYWFSKLSHKIAQLMISKKVTHPIIDILAIGRCARTLILAAKSHPADLYIGHNLAALPAVIKAAKKNKAKAGFDAEDFHRNELTNDISHLDYKLKKRLEDSYLPQLNYLTTSSPEISNCYKKLFPKLSPITLLNVFAPVSIINPSIEKKKMLKLIWFSQTIGFNRGLGDMLKVINQLPAIELHLLGYHDKDTINNLTEFTEQRNLKHIFFHQPIPSTELIQFCSNFDIGLALEPGFSINNDLALSNKIFTYIQAGLAIIASNTTAQQAFMNQYQGMGKIYDRGNLNMLKEILLKYLVNPELVLAHQTRAKNYAEKNLNWEVEKQKFLLIVSHTLKSID